jgi:hypothetical protein
MENQIETLNRNVTDLAQQIILNNNPMSNKLPKEIVPMIFKSFSPSPKRNPKRKIVDQDQTNQTEKIRKVSKSG